MARLRVVSTSKDTAPDLRDSVDSALKNMPWLAESDMAAMVLARRMAEEIETTIDRAKELADCYRNSGGDESILKRLKRLEAMCETTKVVATVGPQLAAILRDLGGTPATRRALKPDKPIGGRLAQLRANVGSREDDAESLD
jgi:hypothetical protein